MATDSRVSARARLINDDRRAVIRWACDHFGIARVGLYQGDVAPFPNRDRPRRPVEDVARDADAWLKQTKHT